MYDDHVWTKLITIHSLNVIIEIIVVTMNEV